VLIVYLIGAGTIAAFVACCSLARKGDGRAQIATEVATAFFVALAAGACLLGLLLMFAGAKLAGTDVGWWSKAQGQQFLVACAGLILLVAAAKAARDARYSLAASLTTSAGCAFFLWAFLLEAGWSGRGPFSS
jgi:hypothetical protein